MFESRVGRGEACEDAGGPLCGAILGHACYGTTCQTIRAVKLEMCVTRAQNDAHLVLIKRETVMRRMWIVVENQVVVRHVRMVRNVIATETECRTCVFEVIVPRVSTVFKMETRLMWTVQDHARNHVLYLQSVRITQTVSRNSVIMVLVSLVRERSNVSQHVVVRAVFLSRETKREKDQIVDRTSMY